MDTTELDLDFYEDKGCPIKKWFKKIILWFSLRCYKDRYKPKQTHRYNYFRDNNI